MNQKGREKQGSEEKRGGKGRTLLCLSSPPNATHVSGLGNNESRSQWDCRHYRVRAGCVCERRLCRRLLFNRWLLPRDRVTFRHLALWAAFLDSTALVWWDTSEVCRPWEAHTYRCAPRFRWSVICNHPVSWTVLYRHTHKEKYNPTHPHTQLLPSFHLCPSQFDGFFIL